MTSALDTIEKPEDRAPIITIFGDVGTGKTSLAATFPKPVFVRAEDGLQAIPASTRPDAFPLLKGKTASDKLAMLRDQLKAILTADHDYKTLVIDSVTALDAIITAAIVESDPKATSINSALGGYGAGPNAVAAKHYGIRQLVGQINEERSMNIVFIGHAGVETINPPDSDSFQRWSLRMPDKSVTPYVQDVDVVGFIRLQAIVTGRDDGGNRASYTGVREIICHPVASNVSKNRCDIDKPLIVERGVNPFIPYISSIAGV